MGTSSSSKGPSAKSPLVPEWADADPKKPLPPPPPGQRFRSFRISFGKAAQGGAGAAAALRSAIGSYARDATGGSSVGPRRFGPAYAAGAALAKALEDLQNGGTGRGPAGVDLRNLIGKSLDEAAQELSKVLAPDNADADQIAVAMQEAMAEALPEAETFEPTQITNEQLVTLMVEFFTRIIFLEIVNVAGDAWKKAPTVRQARRLEKALLELVKAAVEKHLAPRLENGISALSRPEIEKIEKAAITEIWTEWGQLE